MNDERFKHWLECKYLTIAQAALLIMRISPSDWPDEKLLKEPPNGFDAVFQDLLEDAQTPIEEEFVYNEYGDYYSTYELNVINRKSIKSFNKIDGVNIKIRREDLDSWLKRNKRDSLSQILAHVAPTSVEKSLYSTPWLTIQNAAISKFFNPRPSQDAKSDEVLAWINEEAKKIGIGPSDNVAKAIFTIIKPLDHNPKIKRG